MILTFLELDNVFKIHDLMFMDNFIIFRCTVECWDQLRDIGTSLKNYYEKVGEQWGELMSLALLEARGASLKV